MKKEMYLDEEKDCAKMLGMSLDKYRKSLKKIVAPKFEKENEEKKKKDEEILRQLGIDKKLLKREA